MLDELFWAKFSGRSEGWAQLMHSHRHREVFESIDVLMQSLGFSYCFDITMEKGKCLLIFSPEGDEDVARSIDQLVNAAPAIAKWIVFARRPKKDLSDAAAIVRNLYFLDPLRMGFLVREEGNHRVVEMIVPKNSDLLPDEAQGMINTFLWHAVGEDVVMANRLQGRVRFEELAVEEAVPAHEMVAKVQV